MMPAQPDRGVESPHAKEIFFYARVSAKSCRSLCDKLRELDRLRPRLPYIMVRIQSVGGIKKTEIQSVD